MTSNRYAIIDAKGIVTEGSYDFVINVWNSDEDFKYMGRVLFVEIQNEK